MKQFFETLPRRLLWMFAGFGIGQFVGVPFIGGMIARLLDGVGTAAYATSDVIEYFATPEEATAAIAQFGQQGATVKAAWQNRETGDFGVKFDTTNYVEADVIEPLAWGEDCIV